MKRFVPVFAALAVTAVLKFALSGADAGSYRWVLAPTAVLAELVTGSSFRWVNGEGYLDPQAAFLLAPVCSGLNFFVTALLTLAVAQVGLGKTRWVATPVAAYVATVLANTVRVVAAIELKVHRVELPMLSAESAHRLLGVVVYVACLCFLFQLAQRKVSAA